MADDYKLGIYEKALPADLSWEERLDVARQGGFDYLEMSVDETDARLARLEWTPFRRKALVRTMDETGVPIRSICLSAHRTYSFGSMDDAKRQRGLEIMSKAIDLAGDLGVRIIQLAGYDVYYEEGTDETRARFADGLDQAVAMAATAGVCLGFETMETPFMDTVEKSMAYVSQEANPYLGVYPDVGNLTNASFLYGTSVADDIATGAGHIFAAHLKETKAGTYRDMSYSTGTTDYEGALGQLVKQGVRRYVGEFWYLGSESWRDDVSYASTFLRSKIDAAFEAARS